LKKNQEIEKKKIMPPRDESDTLNTTTTDTNSTRTDIAVVVDDDHHLKQNTTTTTHNNNNTSSNTSINNKDDMKYPYHNTPSNIGFFRNTFHWEINIITFSIFFYIYYTIITNTSLHNSILYYISHSIMICIVLDMTIYYYNKGFTPGTPYTLPLVNIIAMVIFPVRYWRELGTIAMESQVGMCTSMMINHFMIFITDHTLCRTVMTSVDDYSVYAHPNAIWLFGSQNLIYMNVDDHKAFRALLTPALFSKEALIQYAQAEEKVCHYYLNQYCSTTSKNQTIDARIAFRVLAAASSQEAFLGPYLTDELRKQLEQDILTFTMGFLSFPIPYMGGLKKAIQAKNRIEHIIASMIPKAYVYLENTNNQPRCMLERWCYAIKEKAQELNVPIDDVPYCNHENMARTVLDFLFAAQDATNSALTFCLDVLDENQDVFNKVRHEIDTVCGRPSTDTATTSSSTTSIWSKMSHSSDVSTLLPYTTKVAIQLLHHKPPVPMIPHIAKRTTTLGNRTIPKNTIVIPSITYSARTSGASKEFNPDRDDDDPLFVSTVVFGAGQHKCPGRKYAESLLFIFLGVLVQNYNFTRINRRPTVDEFVYYPTTFPNECTFQITKRM
jgi:sterol 22-desaturase